MIPRNILVVKKIIAAKPLDGFHLWLRFSDGIEGAADLSDLAGCGVFSAWNTPGVFAGVTVTEFGAVAWGNEIDLCPDTLYLRVTGKTPDDLFPSLSHPERVASIQPRIGAAAPTLGTCPSSPTL